MTPKIQAIAAALVAVIAAGGALGHESHHPSSGRNHGAAIGVPGERSAVTRTVAVDMNDAMRFAPDQIRVRRGEKIRFVVRNLGKIRHEMVLGSKAELTEHAELMRKFPAMEHADPNQVTVEPGKTGELVWRFTAGGTVDFGCLQPGHYESGMAGRIAVR